MNKIYNTPEAVIVTLSTDDIMSVSLTAFDTNNEDKISIGDLLG